MKNINDKQVWVYDIETLASCFTYSAININTEEIVQYVIHPERNDLEALIEHLKHCKGQLGFNNIAFDYPVLHYIIHMSKPIGKKAISLIIDNIYQKAQDTIQAGNSNGFNSALISEKKWKIPQLDLFKLWHFDNKARMTSLKSLEIAMNYPNVMDMPIHHSTKDISLEQVNDILEYNLNDIMATYEFYKLSLDKIQLRKSLFKTYGLNCINYSDSKIGESLILKLYCDKMGTNPYETRKLRSNRSKIALNDLIFPYVKFQSNEFNQILNIFKSKVITETKGSVSESIVYKGFKYDYGSGGIHGCIKSGIYTSDNEYIIIDADVTQMYPSISVNNKLYPEHLGTSFIDLYGDMLKQRVKAKKEGNMIISDAFKLSNNSIYGKSNDINSFLYDPQYTMATTVNGQLLLSMLAESLVDSILDLQVLQINTDGITIRIKRCDMQNYIELCQRWEKQTNLTLEYVEYDKMIISDVNNYIAVKTDGEVKYKGKYEINKEFHKDNSFKIIPIALSEYFVKGIPIEKTIKNHANVYDFCGRQKFKGKDYGVTHQLAYDSTNNPIDFTTKQQKNVRYYISNNGCIFYKYYNKGSNEVINKGYKVTIFNKFEEKINYDINYSFYIKECMKIIENIENKQLELF